MNDEMIQSLIGKSITRINRVCDLVCIQFGIEPDDISIHIQCFFRFLKDKKIVLCSEDMYRCDSRFSYEAFEWDVPGQSIYDDSLSKNLEALQNGKVVKIHQTDCGDFTIFFDGDIQLQVIIDTVEKEEKYRIFSRCGEIVINS